MEFKLDLPVKYITGVYKLVKEYPSNEIDYLYSIIEEIKRVRRSKKNWKEDDFIFSKELIDSVFSENVDSDISELIDLRYISYDDDTLMFKIEPKGLSLIYKF